MQDGTSDDDTVEPIRTKTAKAKTRRRQKQLEEEVEVEQVEEDDSNVGRRVDPTDGNSYTKQEFIECYGGVDEWNTASPAAADDIAAAELIALFG